MFSGRQFKKKKLPNFGDLRCAEHSVVVEPVVEPWSYPSAKSVGLKASGFPGSSLLCRHILRMISLKSGENQSKE